MAKVSIEDWGIGAVLVCRTGEDVKRFWLPSKRQALKSKAELEAGSTADMAGNTGPLPSRGDRDASVNRQ